MGDLTTGYLIGLVFGTVLGFLIGSCTVLFHLFQFQVFGWIAFVGMGMMMGMMLYLLLWSEG